MARISIFALLLLLFAFYFLYQARSFIFGPRLEVIEPRDGEVISRSSIEVNGWAKNIAFLALDGRKIFTDERGAFNEDLLLAPGYNIIVVSARDKFGRSAEKKLSVIVKDR